MRTSRRQMVSTLLAKVPSRRRLYILSAALPFQPCKSHFKFLVTLFQMVNYSLGLVFLLGLRPLAQSGHCTVEIGSHERPKNAREGSPESPNQWKNAQIKQTSSDRLRSVGNSVGRRDTLDTY